MIDVHVPARRDQTLVVTAWLLVAILTPNFIRVTAATTMRASDGFIAYYTAARLMQDGADVERFYDNAWFRAQTKALNTGADDIYNVNPPTTGVMLLPLAGLAHTSARTLWTLLNVGCLVAIVAVILRELDFDGAWAAVGIAVVLTFQPVYENFRFGQAYLLLLALVSVAWYGYRRGRFTPRRYIVLGVALGLLLVLKTAGLLLWLAVVLRQKWRALVWGLGTVAGTVLVTLPILGVASWTRYVSLLPDLSRQPWVAVTVYQTQLGFLRHLFVFDAQWNPAPLVHAPLLAAVLTGLALAGIAGASALFVLHTDDDDLGFAAVVLAGIVVVPVAQEYHFVLALLPAAIVAAALRRQRAARPLWAVFALALVLVGADLPYESPRLSAGGWALLAYPRLYGVWLLWALTLLVSRPLFNERATGVTETNTVAVNNRRPRHGRT